MLTDRKCSLNRGDLRSIVEWAIASAFSDGDFVQIHRDFYWRPDDFHSVFDMDQPTTMDCVGSVCDEIEFLKKSIIEGDKFDVVDIVLERVAFIFLALAVQSKDGLG